MATTEVEWEPEEPPAGPKGYISHKGTLVHYDYPAQGQLIGDCQACMGWCAEVIVKDGEVMIREWHTEGCDVAMTWFLSVCHGDLEPQTYCPRCGAYNSNPAGERPGEDR